MRLHRHAARLLIAGAVLLITAAAPAIARTQLRSCGSHGTALRLVVNGNVTCSEADISAQQMISTYATFNAHFSQMDTGAGFGYDWTCDVNLGGATLFPVRCSSDDYYHLRSLKKGRATMMFVWRIGLRNDAHQCGPHTFSDGQNNYRVYAGEDNPGESCLDLYDFFRQIESSAAGGYPPPRAGWRPDVSSVVDQNYDVSFIYKPHVLIPCRLGASIVLCRPTDNSDLGPAGRFSCKEHFVATTVATPNGSPPAQSVTTRITFTDEWSCERVQRQGKNLVRDEIFRWTDAIEGPAVGQVWRTLP